MYNEILEIKQITNTDTLRQMLAQCEDEIMRLAKGEGNCYYWPRETEELVREEFRYSQSYVCSTLYTSRGEQI